MRYEKVKYEKNTKESVDNDQASKITIPTVTPKVLSRSEESVTSFIKRTAHVY